MAKVKLTDARIKNESLANDKAKRLYDEEVTNLYINISKTKKTFYYRYRFDGKTNQIKLGEYPFITLQDARIKAIDVYRKILNDVDPKAEVKEEKKMVFSDAMDKYQQHHISNLRANSQSVYSFIIGKLESNAGFYNMNLEDVHRSHISEYILEDQNGAKTDHGALNLRNFLSGFFRWSIEMGYIETNPVTHAITFPKPKPRKRFYSEDEIKKVYEALPIVGSPLSDIVNFIFLTGKRKGETLKLKFSMVDWDKRLLTIPSTITKNKSEDVVYLTDSALDIIQRRKQKWNSEYIFVRETVKTPLHRVTYIHHQIEQLRNKSGVEDFRLHDIRRTITVLLSKMGIDQRIKDLILNNASASTIQLTYDVYDYKEEQKQALIQLEAKLEEIISTK